jgi:uncharacterized protein YjiS (DUF1127 family)
MTKQAQSAVDAAFDGHAGESGSLFAKAQSFVSQTLRRLNKEVGNQRAIWELSQLDDHALRDIGISRSQIETLVRGRK